MCNCGNKRSELKQTAQRFSGNVVMEKNSSRYWKDIAFEYTGTSGLTATGNVTRRRYRFNKTGDVQLVDYRDASAMTGIPVLKKV